MNRCLVGFLIYAFYRSDCRLSSIKKILLIYVEWKHTHRCICRYYRWISIYILVYSIDQNGIDSIPYLHAVTICFLGYDVVRIYEL